MSFGRDFAIEMQGVASSLLSQFDGREGTSRIAIIVQGDKTFNETTAEYEFGPDVTYFLTGVQKTVSAGLVDGTTIQSGDQMITASIEVVDAAGAKVNYVPRVKDKVLMDGVTWSIVNAPHVNYTGNNLYILYKMQLRK